MITIRHDLERPTADVLTRFKAFPAADVVDAMGGTGAIDFGIRSLFPTGGFVGSVLTVQTPPNDNLAPYVALDVVEPGDVVVISTRDFTAGATIGDTVLSYYKQRGVAAVVLDGLARDLIGLQAIGLPVYARGLSPNAPQKHGPGFIGFDITLGGIHIASGDIAVGDSDGVAIVPKDRMESVLKTLEARAGVAPAAPTGARELPAWLDAYISGGEVRRI